MSIVIKVDALHHIHFRYAYTNMGGGGLVYQIDCSESMNTRRVLEPSICPLRLETTNGFPCVHVVPTSMPCDRR
jgi:hypothetical protein